MSAVAGCAGFAAVCGDSIATAVTMGTVSLPEMKKKKYAPSLATGCIASGGTLGILRSRPVSGGGYRLCYRC
ncbi:MAG: TRAP transporter large permease subunit [Dehalobacterium sp.]